MLDSQLQTCLTEVTRAACTPFTSGASLLLQLTNCISFADVFLIDSSEKDRFAAAPRAACAFTPLRAASSVFTIAFASKVPLVSVILTSFCAASDPQPLYRRRGSEKEWSAKRAFVYVLHSVRVTRHVFELLPVIAASGHNCLRKNTNIVCI